MPLLRVCPYEPDALASILSNEYISSDCLKNEKFHYKYFLNYLGGNNGSLSAKTIVVEKEYISISYLNDYSAYYSLCFSDKYKRKCSRVHFFNSEFSEEDFIRDITNNSGRFVNDDTYLGYIVVKNLPTVNIGATLLKTCNDNNSSYFITKDCEVSVYGKKIGYKSLVFQEQDKVVSACATSALWMAFFKTSCFFQTKLPSPSEITSSAKNSYNFSGRTFPNKKGLDLFQIGNAIDSVGLEFELRNNNKVNIPSHVKAFIYSYLKLGIPVLLGICFSQNNQDLHLITLTGFKYNSGNRKIKKRKDATPLVSDGIELFYAHDDRIGPYSRLKILDSAKDNRFIETAWPDKKNPNKHRNASVTSIIVPIQKKIRISFEDVLSQIEGFDHLFSVWFGKKIEYKWDLYIASSNKYKEEVSNNLDLNSFFKERILFKQLPKYIWIARLMIDDAIVMELLFDSTDVPDGNFCILISCYDSFVRGLFKQHVGGQGFRYYWESILNDHYVSLLSDAIQ